MALELGNDNQQHAPSCYDAMPIHPLSAAARLPLPHVRLMFRAIRISMAIQCPYEGAAAPCNTLQACLKTVLSASQTHGARFAQVHSDVRKPSGPQHCASGSAAPVLALVAFQTHTSLSERNLPPGSSSCTAGFRTHEGEDLQSLLAGHSPFRSCRCSPC